MPSKYFTIDDLKCPCNKCKNKIYTWDMFNNEFIEKLDLLREQVPELIITSAYRCEEYNKKVGGRDNSFHTNGMAADVSLKSPSFEKLKQLFLLAVKLGFTGVGFYPSNGFIHIDVGPRIQFWRRDVRKIYHYFFIND